MSYHPHAADIAAVAVLAFFALLAVVNPWRTVNAHLLARGFGAFAGASFAIFILGFQTPLAVVAGFLGGALLFGLPARMRRR